MNLIGKLQPVIIITAALLGLLLGAVTPLGEVSSSLIEVFLMMLLYILFLSIDLKQIKKSFIQFTVSALRNSSVIYFIKKLLKDSFLDLFWIDLNFCCCWMSVVARSTFNKCCHRNTKMLSLNKGVPL